MAGSFKSTALAVLAVCGCFGQTAKLTPATRIELPTHIDGNSPSYWTPDGLRLFTSIGNPEMVSLAPNQYGPWESQSVDLTDQQHIPLWIESAYYDSNGTLYGWYHHEPGGVCPGKSLSMPSIGAVVSYDGGLTIQDLGIVLQSGYAPDCATKNEYFAGGHGDFTVVPDRLGKYFYFYFTNYSGPDDEQGIAVARLAVEDLLHPGGAVWKYFGGDWTEPGLGGRTTPIFPATVNWQKSNTDSFWGPAVHWNYHLDSYVMLLNRSCCGPNFPQAGIYLAFNPDPANPTGWQQPSLLLDNEQIGFGPGFYPQVMGLMWGDTDSYSGERARLYIHGISDWEIHFVKPQPPPPPPEEPEPGDDPPPDPPDGSRTRH